MELDELKNGLNKKLEQGGPLLSAKELETIIGRKTSSILAKVKRSIRLEWILSLFFIVCFSLLAYWIKELYFQFFSIFAVLFCVFFLYWLRSLKKKIHFYEQSSPTIKEALEQTISILQRFTRLYFQLSIGMIPVAFLMGLVVGYMDLSQKGLLENFHLARGLTFYIGWFIFWAIATYFFTRWYIKKMYGNYLEQLKSQLNDLKNG